jgi:hypothetical protein
MTPISITDIENGAKIFKPHTEEFGADTDFAAIAQHLNVPADQVTWTVEDDAIDGIDGHSLVGRTA